LWKGSTNNLQRFLKQRGLSVCQCEPQERTLHFQIGKEELQEKFNSSLSSYSFRIFLRDIIAIRREIEPGRFGLFIEKDKVQSFLNLAEELTILEREVDGKYLFPFDNITDFGDTFEYFVSRILTDMGYDVTWGVKFDGISSGGDFDILGLAAGKFFYIETKTSPPKHVEMTEINSFIERVFALKPDFGILLNDTHLRMKDKLVPLMEEAMREKTGRKVIMKRVNREIFSLEGKIFISNTKRDIGINIKTCFKEFFHQDWIKGIPFLD
jgi:hypothetical protein